VSVPSLFSLPFSTLIACRACDGELVGAPAVPCTVRLDSCNHTKDRIARLCYLRRPLPSIWPSLRHHVSWRRKTFVAFHPA
jgi:hypothetical protein